MGRHVSPLLALRTQFAHSDLAHTTHPLASRDTVPVPAAASPTNLISTRELLRRVLLACTLAHPVSSFLWFDMCEGAWPSKVSPADLDPVLASVSSNGLPVVVESAKPVDLWQAVWCPMASPADLNPVPASVGSTEVVVCRIVCCSVGSPADLSQVFLDSGSSTELVVCRVVCCSVGSPADLSQVSLDSGFDVCNVDMMSLGSLPCAMRPEHVFALTPDPLQFPSHSRG